jgi:predicted RecA/RadA family phage recombinase
MDPRQHVNPGDPIRLAASQINGLNRLLTPNAGFGMPAAGEPPTPYTWVMAKNNTGAKVERWGVLAITGMDISPSGGSNAEGQFEKLPVVAGGTPSDTTTAWCVAVEPIAAGKIGRVAVGGVVQLKAADLGKASGAHVLWKDSNWALVRIQSGVVRGTFTAPWNKGATKTITDAVTAGTTYADVKNYFANVTGTGSKACAIAYVGTEWILIAAEC